LNIDNNIENEQGQQIKQQSHVSSINIKYAYKKLEIRTTLEPGRGIYALENIKIGQYYFLYACAWGNE